MRNSNFTNRCRTRAKAIRQLAIVKDTRKPSVKSAIITTETYMKSVIVGSGGREHALAHVLGRDSDVTVTPSNRDSNSTTQSH